MNEKLNTIDFCQVHCSIETENAAVLCSVQRFPTQSDRKLKLVVQKNDRKLKSYLKYSKESKWLL